MSNFIKVSLIVTGSIAVALGVIGIFLPILPTTPFLLLGAGCYIRSSKKLYNWLINNKYLGNYIKNYCEKRGIPLKIKIYSISMLWISIILSCVFAISKWGLRVMLLLIASGVTVHILKIKTLEQDYIEEESMEYNVRESQDISS